MAKRPTTPHITNTPEGPGLGLNHFDATAADGPGVDHTDADTDGDTDTAPDPAAAAPAAAVPARRHHAEPVRPPSAPYPAYGAPVDWTGWIHPATDPKGHHSKISLRVQPTVARQIQMVLASKKFPYSTPNDLIRHAIYQHLQWLESIDRTIPSVLAQVDAINALVVDDQLLQEQAQVLSRLLASVERHLALGDTEQAQRLVDTAMSSIDRMPPGSWRDSYRAKFAGAFGYRGGPEVTAGPGPATVDPAHPHQHQQPARRGKR